jgi:spore germination cell wall hydrolase CwlJ-like protein
MQVYKLVLMFLMNFGVESASADRPSNDRRLSCQNPQSDLACMACNCFNEAGNQSYAGQVAVGKVVQTRRYLFAADRKFEAGRPAAFVE